MLVRPRSRPSPRSPSRHSQGRGPLTLRPCITRMTTCRSRGPPLVRRSPRSKARHPPVRQSAKRQRPAAGLPAVDSASSSLPISMWSLEDGRSCQPTGCHLPRLHGRIAPSNVGACARLCRNRPYACCTTEHWPCLLAGSPADRTPVVLDGALFTQVLQDAVVLGARPADDHPEGVWRRSFLRLGVLGFMPADASGVLPPPPCHVGGNSARRGPTRHVRDVQP